MPTRHGNGAGWGRVLPSPSPYPILTYLPVTLPIPNGDEKLNLIPDEFGDPIPIPVPVVNHFLLIFLFSNPNGNIVKHYVPFNISRKVSPDNEICRLDWSEMI